MKKLKMTALKFFLMLNLAFLAHLSYAKVGFTIEEVRAIQAACLAGSKGYNISLDGDGGLSLGNAQGKGKLKITSDGREYSTPPLLDTEKKQELDDVRSCIKEYLMQDKSLISSVQKIINDSNDSTKSVDLSKFAGNWEILFVNLQDTSGQSIVYRPIRL
jgi:hypothetical protein